MAGWPVLTAIAVLLAAPGQALVPAAHLQKGLESGEWELRERGADDVRRLCVSHLNQLLQSGHAGKSCKSFTVSDTPRHMIVTYDCGGAGNGRTDLRIETPRLVQIQSQGIAAGAPFDFAVEARWVRACR